MAAILDRCVPSRRQERKRQRAEQDTLDARFGDTHITAPTEGAWNQIGSGVEKKPTPDFLAIGSFSPDLSIEEPLSGSKVSPEMMAEENRARKDNEKHNFTITIPLPWSSRKSHQRTYSAANPSSLTSTTKDERPELSPRSIISSTEATPRSFLSSPDPNASSYLSSPDTTLHSRATSPVIYKPASEEYRQHLSEMASGIHRVESPSVTLLDPNQNPSAADVIYKSASVDFVKEMAEIGLGPSPALPPRDTYPHPRAEFKSTSPGLPSDPRPKPINELLEATPSPTSVAARPRTGTSRSASRGPASDRIAMASAASHGPASNWVESTEEPSHGRALDSMGIYPAASPRPGVERLATFRSASRGALAERTGVSWSDPATPEADTMHIGHSASPAPAADRIGTTRSSSRGPPLSRTGKARSASQGPPSDRAGTVRSSSRGPASDRLPTTRSTARGRANSSQGPAPTRIPYRESVSSDSSAGSGITTASSPTFSSSLSTVNTGSSAATHTNPTIAEEPHTLIQSYDQTISSLDRPAGYYTSVAQEYRRIAHDVEEDEAERRRRKIKGGKQGAKEMEKEKETVKQKVKEKVKGKDRGWQQDMVPDADELW